MTEHDAVHFSAEAKTQAVLRALRGESLALLAKELNTSTDRIARWQARFVEGGSAAVSQRRTHSRRRSTSSWLAALLLGMALLGGIVAFAVFRN
jgi:transposase-like protein